jgi:hypothetical protein
MHRERLSGRPDRTGVLVDWQCGQPASPAGPSRIAEVGRETEGRERMGLH